MAFDLETSLRRRKPQRSSPPLRRRSSAELLAASSAFGDAQLLLDTTVYVDLMQRRAPSGLRDRVDAALVTHSTVALSELTPLFGRLDPRHGGTKKVLRDLTNFLLKLSVRRLSTPSVQTFAEAGMLAGLASRLTSREHGVELLNDAALLLHAQETDKLLVTRNIADFDILQQLTPEARVLYYIQA